MLRQDAGSFMLGKYLSDTNIPEAIECFLWPLVFQNIYQNILKRSSTYVLKDLQNMLVHSGAFKNLQNIRALNYSGDSEANETIGSGSGRKYANSHFLTKIGKMQSAGCRMCQLCSNEPARQGQRSRSIYRPTPLLP